MPTVYSFLVPTLSCGRCVSHIENKLKASVALGVERIAHNVSKKKIGILLREDLPEALLRDEITKALLGSGFSPAFSDETTLAEQTQLHWIYGLIGVGAGAALLAVSLLVGALPLSIMLPIAGLSSALTLFLGAASYERAWIELFESKFSMDSLFAVSTLIVLMTSVGSFFIPWLPMMFDTGLLIFGFRHLGLGIEGSVTKSMQFGVRFTDRLPKQVRVLTSENQFEFRDIYSIQPGETIEVFQGECVPLDGECLDESRYIYNPMITGQTEPCEVKKGELVFSGADVFEGSSLRLRVNSSFEKSHLYRLDQRMFDAEFENKAEYEVFADQILNYFVPVIFLLAVVSAVIISCFFPIEIAICCAIAVLVSACPCTLGLVVALAVLIAQYKAVENGIEFFSGEQLQRAVDVKCVVFDYNGTFTTGAPKVLRAHCFDSSLSEAAFFNTIAQLEKTSKHPVGRALFEYVNGQAIADERVTVEKQYFGVGGSIGDEAFLLGSSSLMLKNQVSLKQMETQGALSALERIVYLARDQQLLGYFVLKTSLRQGTDEVLNFLRKEKIDFFISSGSPLSELQWFIDKYQIPLSHIKAAQQGALRVDDEEDDKSRLIKQLKKPGYSVAMIGDEANDVLAIEASDFGVALCHAYCNEKMTQMKASAVIKGESLLPLVNIFVISKQMNDNILQNLIMSLIYNVVCELLAAGVLAVLGVLLNPGVGVVLMIVQMCLILANAYWFKLQPLAHLDVQPEDAFEPTLNASQTNVSQEKLSEPSWFSSAFSFFGTSSTVAWLPNTQIQQPH